MSPAEDDKKKSRKRPESAAQKSKQVKESAGSVMAESNLPPESGNTLSSSTTNQTEKVKRKKSLSIGQSIFGYFFTIAVSVFFAVVITLLAVPLAMRVNPFTFYNSDFIKSSNGSKTIIQANEEENLIAAVAEKVKPSIVTISVVKNSSPSSFFPELEQQEPQASGSGVVYRKDGYIITNNHVVEDSKKISVAIGNFDDIEGKLVAGDSEADIAVVKVDKDDLPAAETGSTKKLKVGDKAVAIGTPFRFQHSVTAGIISAKKRTINIPGSDGASQKTFTDMLQTDAAINPGNSGGALANSKGEVIGINTVIASTSGSSAGIGFAIPIEKAKDIADQLISKGKASHPYIGVTIDTVTEDISKERKIPKGVWVVQVMADSPADKAGLKNGDVIIRADGEKVDEADELIASIRRGKVGSKLKITYVRNKKETEVEVALAEKPSRLIP